MHQNSSDLSEEMYHRLYRLAKREVDPRLIAAALNIPLRTVHTVLERMKQPKGDDTVKNTTELPHHSHKQKAEDETGFLDIYFYPKIRYAILQLVGVVSQQTCDMLGKEFKRIFSSSWKAVALRLTDVTKLDKNGSILITQFYLDMEKHGRYIALLDPAPEIDPALREYGIEDTVPVFGTERAFEEKAFAHRNTSGTAWKVRP